MPSSPATRALLAPVLDGDRLQAATLMLCDAVLRRPGARRGHGAAGRAAAS